MVLHHLFEFGEIRRALVVAPLRPVYSVWPNEIRKWGFPYSCAVLHNQLQKALGWETQIEIVNYEGLAKLKTITKRWDMLVLDESTWIKTWSAARSKNLRALLPSIPKRMILTGTPAANSLLDLYPQIYALDQGKALGKNVTAFRKEYGALGGYPYPKWSMREAKIEQLNAAIAPLVLRMQAEDHLDMPRLVHNDIWCELEPSEQRAYAKFREELYLELVSGTITAVSAAAAYIKCVQFANGGIYHTDDAGVRTSHGVHSHKISALRELYGELNGKPALIFYSFGHDLERILACPEFKGAPVINGKTPAKDAETYIERWNRGAYSAMLCQWQAASHGLNLQYSCNDVVCFGLPDRPESFDQAFRRVYRQGVKGEQVRIHRILMTDTVDEVMKERLDGKFANQREFLDALKRHAHTDVRAVA